MNTEPSKNSDQPSTTRTALVTLGLTAAALTGTAVVAGAAGAAFQDDGDQPVLTEQVDGAVDSDLAEDNAADEEGHRGRRGMRGNRSEVLTDVLGIEAQELRTSLRAGDTIADVAAANGVDTQVVIDTLVAELTNKVQEAVSEGRITAEQADERLAGLEERVTEKVNNPFERGEGRRGHHHGADTDAETPEVAEPGAS